MLFDESLVPVLVILILEWFCLGSPDFTGRSRIYNVRYGNGLSSVEVEEVSMLLEEEIIRTVSGWVSGVRNVVRTQGVGG